MGKRILSTANKRKSTPLFILGSGRSGTTLLQRLLNRINGVLIWGEHGGFLKQIAEAYFHTLFDEINARKLALLQKKKSDIRSAIIELKNLRNFTAWTNFFGEREFKKSYRTFVKSFFYCSMARPRYWGFKEIRYGVQDSVLDFILDILPESKFIFIVRNPMDVIASQLTVFARGDRDQLPVISRKWIIQNRYFQEFQARFEKNCTLIRYEDLIERDKSTFGSLSLFLDLTFLPCILKTIDLENGRGEDHWAPDRKQLWNEREFREIVPGLVETAAQFGYSLDSIPEKPR